MSTLYRLLVRFIALSCNYACTSPPSVQVKQKLNYAHWTTLTKLQFNDVNGHHIEKVGSWVSTTWESDANKHFWPLPNIVAVRSR
jgi:hypothetical protein